jgi:ribosomal-protein-alanine N-acetyltransferase
MSAGVSLRAMRWWDLPAVLRLEADLFPDDAWSPGMFWSELADVRMRRYVVAQERGRVIGYSGLAVAADQADVQTIAVARSHWARGVGAALLADLVAEARRRGCVRVLLEVRVDNDRAQRLYERFGFVRLGLRRGYYQPANVDAQVMELDLTTTAEAGAAERPRRQGVTRG